MRDPVTLGTVLAEKRRALREADTKVFNRTNSLNEAKAEQEALREEIKALAAEFQAQAESILSAEPVQDQTAIFNDAAVTAAFERATTPQDGLNGAAF